MAHRRTAMAEQAARDRLAREPGHIPSLARLARMALDSDRLDEAIGLYSRLAGLQPERKEWLGMLARAQAEANRPEAAEATCRRILAEGPADARLHMVHGDLLRALGKTGEAIGAYRAALEAEPGHGRAIWSLARFSPASGHSALEELAQDALARAERGSEHESLLHFALGELRHAAGAWDSAFAEFRRGNEIQKLQQPFDPAGFALAVEGLEFRLRSLPKRNAAAAGGDGLVPVFILGMPRSGSTLIEQMLACHSEAEALGELPTLGRLAMSGPDRSPERIGADYLARASLRRRGEARFLIDKMHMNWLELPTILEALPQAKIVDPRREPMDCCWSNYRFPFHHGHPASAGLEWLAIFYRSYDRLLATAQEAFPERVYRVGYERLVDDAERELTALLDWLGLGFEPACLEFHRSASPVATASSEQVRRPLNRSGIGAHRPYAPFLADLARALAEPEP